MEKISQKLNNEILIENQKKIEQYDFSNLKQVEKKIKHAESIPEQILEQVKTLGGSSNVLFERLKPVIDKIKYMTDRIRFHTKTVALAIGLSSSALKGQGTGTLQEVIIPSNTVKVENTNSQLTSDKPQEYSVIDKQTKFIINAEGKTKIPYVEHNFYSRPDNKIIRTEKLDPITLQALPFDGIANQFREQRKPLLDVEKLKKDRLEYAKEEYDWYINSDYAKKLQRSDRSEDKEEFENAMKLLNDQIASAESEGQAEYDSNVETFKQFDKEKEWLANVITSPEYKRRAKVYEQLSDEEIKQRLKRVEDVDYDVVPITDVGGALATTTVEKNTETGELRAKINTLPVSRARDQQYGTMVHEGQHISTLNEIGMSRYAKELYKKAYRPTSVHLENFSELDARKRMVEYFLDQKGIKKYDEPFTQEHYQILKKLLEEHGPQNDPNFPQDVQDFIKNIDPAYIEQIMNTIALNEDFHNETSVS